MKAIGLDIGTTTICSVLVERESGILLDSKTCPNDTWTAGREPWEKVQDAERIVEKCRSLVKNYTEENNDIVSIGVTGQMHGIVYVNHEGKSVSPLYTWQDPRGNLEYADGLSYAQYLTEKTGCRMASGYGMCTHFYNCENGLVPEGAASFVTIADYAAMSLAGRNVPLMHQSMAASLGLYDLDAQDFMKEVAEKLGMHSCDFPESTSETALIGTTEDGILVAVGLGDNQASFLGAVGSVDGLLLNVGTGSQVSAGCRQRTCGNDVEYRPFLRDTYLAVGSPLCGGYAYSLLKNFAEEILKLAGASAERPVYDMLNEEADRACRQGSQIKVDTRFNGSREDASVLGSICNLSADTFRVGDFALGILKGICEELYQYYCSFPEEAKRASVLTGSGNGIRNNELLRRICCERFGMEMTMPAHSEEAGYGAAVFSMMAAGVMEIN